MERFLSVKTRPPHAEVTGHPRATFGRPLAPASPGGKRQGVFAGWEWDGQRLVVTNDRYAIIPLFYYQDGRGVIVSNSLARVVELGAPRDLDFDALSVFLRCQLFLGEDTPFRHVRQLPPGSTLVWSDGHARLESRPPAPRPVTIPRAETVDAYIELFRQSIRRRLPDVDGQEVVLPLSGGQDSRHILLELLAQGRTPARCVTVARSWSPKLMDDARLAAVVAGRAGVPHTVLLQDDPIFAQECRKNVLTNLCTADHAWFLSLVDHGDLSRALVFDGIAGDILSACQLLDDRLVDLYRGGRFHSLAEIFLGDEAVYPRVFHPSFYAQVGRDRAADRLAAEFARHADAPSPLTSFYFWNRTRRSIGPSPYAILDEFTTVDAPYLDDDLFDFLIGRPSVDLDPNFHKRAMSAAYPHFEGIPFSELSAPIADRPGAFVRFARDLSRSLLTTPRENLSLLKKGYVVPRLSRSALDPNYALACAWLPPLVVYLSQLSALALHGHRTRPSGVTGAELPGTPGDLVVQVDGR